MRSKVFLVDCIGKYSSSLTNLLRSFSPHITLGSQTYNRYRRNYVYQEDLGKIYFLLERYLAKFQFYDLRENKNYQDILNLLKYFKDNQIQPIEVIIPPKKEFIPPEIRGCVLLNHIFNSTRERGLARILLKEKAIFPEKIITDPKTHKKYCYYTQEQCLKMQKLEFKSPYKKRIIEKIKVFFKEYSDEKSTKN